MPVTSGPMVPVPQGRLRRAALVAVIGLVPLTNGPMAASVQQAEPSFELPSTGDAREAQLEAGESHDWRMHLEAGEFLQVDFEPLAHGDNDEWPSVSVRAPDGTVVAEVAEASLSPSIDSRAYSVVSFIGGSSGMHRLRVGAGASPVRYRLVVRARRPALEEDSRRIEAHGLWRAATRLWRQGPASQRASAETFEEAVSILSGIGDAEGEALTLGNLAAVWYRQSDAARGRAAAARALEIWTSLGREREAGVALSDLGVLAYLAYDRPTARRHYEDALVKLRASGDDLGEARTLTRLGWVQYAAAELQEVVATSQEALGLYRRAGDRAGESIAHNDLGRAYLDLGEVTQALDAFQQALALRPPDRDARGAANVLIRMALVYLNVAEWQQALDALRQAQALARRAHDVRTECTALVNLGSVYVTLGDTSEGRRHLEPALKLARSIDFRGAQAYTLLWLGIAASLDGEPAQSRQLLEEAVSTQRAIKDVRGEASALRQLATVQLALGLPAEARQSVTRSVEISPPASGLIYTGALTLADVHAALGDASSAEAQYKEALARFREIRARHAEVLALSRYARFLAGRDRLPEARALLEQGLAVHESLRGLIVDPDLRMSYSSTLLEPYRLNLDVLMALEARSPGEGFAAAAFQTNERARARGLLDLLVAAGIDLREGVDGALVDRERTLRWKLNAKAAIQTRLLSGTPDRRRLATLEREIADLSREWREATTQIRQQSPAYASLIEPRPVTVDAVQPLLDADTVLLEFARGERSAWLFAVTRTAFHSVELPSWQAIDEAARGVHRLLTARQPVEGEVPARRQARVRRADAALKARSLALSNLVLGPIGDRLASDWRGRRLVIVAPGALEYVPFAALPLPRSANRGATPLLATHEVVSLPSASTLAVLRHEAPRRRPARRAIAVLADPVFSADDPRVGTRAPASGAATNSVTARTRLQAPEADRRTGEAVADTGRGSLARLPFSREEAAAVAAQVPRGDRLHATDFDATLALVTGGGLDDFRILHFATHGLVNEKRPELSGLALSLVDAEGRSLDGFLRLNTIYNLRLSSDLVVLSACQSALGREVDGEGLVGLTRGFMHAGARGVVASLWQVNDAATAELMKRFYTGLLRRRLPPAAALRAAQLQMAHDPRWKAPYFWAGFVLQGDWQP